MGVYDPAPAGADDTPLAWRAAATSSVTSTGQPNTAQVAPAARNAATWFAQRRRGGRRGARPGDFELAACAALGHRGGVRVPHVEGCTGRARLFVATGRAAGNPHGHAGMDEFAGQLDQLDAALHRGSERDAKGAVLFLAQPVPGPEPGDDAPGRQLLERGELRRQHRIGHEANPRYERAEEGAATAPTGTARPGRTPRRR